MKILVVSDEDIPSSALKHLLQSEVDFSVVGACPSRSALRAIQKHEPNVILIHAPGTKKSAEEVVSRWKMVLPQTRVLVIERNPSNPELRSLLTAGVDGVVLLDTTPAHLFDAIRVVGAGERFIDPKLSGQLIGLLLEHGSTAASLSRREQQVLRLIAYGYTVKEIGNALSISHKSVETYLARLREKLHLRTRAEIVKYALKAGLFSDTGGKGK